MSDTEGTPRSLGLGGHVVLRKCAGFTCYSLCLLGVLILLKTEARKWLGMSGDATPANTLVFWISLGWAVLFGYLGAKIWPSATQEPEDQSA